MVHLEKDTEQIIAGKDKWRQSTAFSTLRDLEINIKVGACFRNQIKILEWDTSAP